MAFADISELDLMQDRTQYDDEKLRTLLTLLIARVLQVDTDTIDIIEFEPPEDKRVFAQVVCDKCRPNNIQEIEVNLQTGTIFSDN